MAEITQQTMNIIWIVAIIGFAVLEAATAQLVSIWFVIGAFAALISSLCNAPLYIQLILFTVVTVLALVVTRPLVKKYIKPKIVPTNADRVIGKTAIVTEEINSIEAKGLVKVNGESWSARALDDSVIETDTLVEVVKISGVKLIVKKKD